MEKKYFILFILFLYNNLCYAQNKKNNIYINVDLRKSEKKQSVVGFLHFTDLKLIENQVDILKPSFWRVGAKLKDKNLRKEQINLLLNKNISPIFVISDLYDWWPWDKRSYGWINPNNSSDKKELEILPELLVKEWGANIIYDLWNEPDVKDCWKGSREDFFKTSKIIHDKIRATPGGENAIITGPSISRFDEQFINDFLKFCVDNNMKIDILNWHDIGDKKDGITLEKNIELVRTKILKKFPQVGIKKIYIPEIVGYSDQFDPLTPFEYINIAEKNGVSGFCKTCWDNPGVPGDSNCWNNSIDGIVDKNGNPRANWWFYKLYAESLENRFSSFSYDSNIISLFYLDKNKNISGLIGNLGDRSNNTVFINFINFSKSLYLSNRKKKLYLYYIPDLGEKNLQAPVLLMTKNIKSSSMYHSIDIPNFNKKGLYYIKLAE